MNDDENAKNTHTKTKYSPVHTMVSAQAHVAGIIFVESSHFGMAGCYIKLPLCMLWEVKSLILRADFTDILFRDTLQQHIPTA